MKSIASKGGDICLFIAGFIMGLFVGANLALIIYAFILNSKNKMI